ncbi:glycosyltransferase family 2 protein [Olivibacter sp. SDN3]|uniref:glycosyltransferase family 2 protein n=1 Tax=Olivibacter sp. SDN3 TaxID=2764720 RepID=UPI001650FD90|nr:glycosyltransferase family 2 protein [Olivibacter sp. SDN3]QNL48442.1 glycosyltransferase family 2 protein [Olivibacter sp. SDN3]
MIKKVAIVILNWNGKSYLEKFLPSICSSNYSNLEIVVGDNGSTDDSVRFLAHNYPQIKQIKTGVNLGYAAGYNYVLNRVDADYFILLNSDVEVSRDWIKPVIKMMESDPAIAAVQPKILSYRQPEEFEHAGAAGGYIDKFGYPFCAGRILDSTETDHGQYDVSREIFWATGAAFFIRRDAWQEMHGLDNDFFAHMEEIDLCWRLKAAGYKIWYCAQSTVYHVGGGTLNKENPYKTYLNFRNSLYMLQKNLSLISALFVICLRLWLDLLALIRFLYEGKRKDALAVNKAHISFFRNFRKTANKRKKQIKNYKISCVYNGSIVWDYFARGIKKYSKLKQEKFL